MGMPLARTAKSIAIMGRDDGKDQFVLALVRGDHMVNEIKLAKLPGLAEYRLATEAEIADHLGSEPGFLGPLAAKKPIRVVADRSVAAMADFVVGANRPGFHIAGVNWGRDLPSPSGGGHPQRGRGRCLAGWPGRAGHRARHRGRPRVRARPQVFRGDEVRRCWTRTARRASMYDGLLRHRRQPHRRRRDRTEPRRQRHPLARGDRALPRSPCCRSAWTAASACARPPRSCTPN
jgi:hypothetical protein